MRFLSLIALLTVCSVCSPDNAGLKNAAAQPDIGKSGRDFLEICSAVDSDQKGDPVRIQNDATCLGWVEGFRDGFTVHDELLSVPRRDRIVCIPSGVMLRRPLLLAAAHTDATPHSQRAHHRTSARTKRSAPSPDNRTARR